jgi:hypothetical protein
MTAKGWGETPLPSRIDDASRHTDQSGGSNDRYLTGAEPVRPARYPMTGRKLDARLLGRG